MSSDPDPEVDELCIAVGDLVVKVSKAKAAPSTDDYIQYRDQIITKDATSRLERYHKHSRLVQKLRPISWELGSHGQRRRRADAERRCYEGLVGSGSH